MAGIAELDTVGDALSVLAAFADCLAVAEGPAPAAAAGGVPVSATPARAGVADVAPIVPAALHTRAAVSAASTPDLTPDLWARLPFAGMCLLVDDHPGSCLDIFTMIQNDTLVNDLCLCPKKFCYICTLSPTLSK
jgi:hypothetical protein